MSQLQHDPAAVNKVVGVSMLASDQFNQSFGPESYHIE